MITSKLCTFSDYQATYYRDALVALKEGFILHRKQWEFAMIYQVLNERGFLQEGKKGIGFAVGTEPLPSLFCSKGVDVIASDQYISDQAIASWGGGQLCEGIEQLNVRGLCDPDKYATKCKFKRIDMNQLPDDLEKQDFIWSSCSFEHLGNLQKGIDFVVGSTKYLKPGGIAVHTTEYNLSSNERTVSEGGSVYYRKRDIESLERQLEQVGCKLLPVDYSYGDHQIDNLVDDRKRLGPPHLHLKLQIDDYILTSILLIIVKS